MRKMAIIIFAGLLMACATSRGRGVNQGSEYLFVWASDAGARKSDFLAVINANPKSDHYGEVIATAPTGVARSAAHHTEHIMPSGGILFANGFAAGRTFLFDLRDPKHPRLAGSFGAAAEFMHPHSFVREPNGNLLSTFQMKGHDNAEPGALVELSPKGEILRVSSASDPHGEGFIRPYSLAILPNVDRVVTTSADMHRKAVSHSVQVWRLSDLKLIKTVRLPQGPLGAEANDPAEPRVLRDGKTVVVSTFSCGLYLLKDLDSQSPSAELIHSMGDGGECALPVVAGRFWVQTDTAIPGLVAFDMSDPDHPKEVSRLILAKGMQPHWIALAPDGHRIVISGGKQALLTRVLLATIDPRTGELKLDTRFRDKGSAQPGISFDRASWPHGTTGRAVPHGAVFSLPDQGR
jgi:hypothetical protein